MKKFMTSFLQEEEGQGMAEYALVLGVIAVGVVALLAGFGSTIKGLFEDIIGQFEGEVDKS
jgi:pilus assembly protein Flp/PilA